jgi:GNAT superfamily N-acetyltransferase
MPDAGRLRIREVVSPRDSAFRAAYRLLAGVFPRDELLPRRDWNATMREREQGLWTDLNWHVLIAERGRRLLGVATGSYVGNLNVGVIGYIAVGRRVRSQGVGPRLRRRLYAALARDARRIRARPLAALVGEVRADNPWLHHLVRRTGALALDFPYYQPSLRAQREPVPLVLYYQPLLRRRAWLPVGELRRILYTLWRRPYRVGRPLARPAFRRMLRALHGRRRIGARALPPAAGAAGRDVE